MPVLMSMMISQILKFVESLKTKKSQYLENKTLLFLQTEKLIIKKIFLVEVTFKKFFVV